MSDNTDKLLRALIDALGFEVETTLDYDERKIDKGQHSHNVAKWRPDSERTTITDGAGMYLFDDKQMYTSILKKPIVDYKLTKKGGE